MNWIKTSDLLPPSLTAVYFVRNGKVSKGYFDNSSKRPLFHEGPQFWEMADGVTHWMAEVMPLPPTPAPVAEPDGFKRFEKLCETLGAKTILEHEWMKAGYSIGVYDERKRWVLGGCGGNVANPNP